MVERNEIYSGLAPRPLSLLLRSLIDFRTKAELALLPIIDYFIYKTESKNKIIKLPAKVFYGQKPYLTYIGEKYYKRNFKFLFTNTYSLATYDLLGKLIRNTRKTIEYNLGDTIEFMHAYQNYFKNIKLPASLATDLKGISKKFKKVQIPGVVLEALKKIKLNTIKFKQENKSEILRYSKPFLLYIDVLFFMHIAIRDEILRLVDFLLEYNKKIIHSNKLCEIEKEIRFFSETYYGKKRFAVKIHPFNSVKNKTEIIIDQVASNVLRAIKLQNEIAEDLANFLLNEASEEEKILYKINRNKFLEYYVSLGFKDNVPKNLLPFTDKKIFTKFK